MKVLLLAARILEQPGCSSVAVPLPSLLSYTVRRLNSRRELCTSIECPSSHYYFYTAMSYNFKGGLY